MLIDDNPADNLYHRIIIGDMNITERIEVAIDGVEALQFLRKKNQTPPELIFLDINMPKMNGWEFLEVYKNLSKEQQSRIVIVMLTTSQNPADEEKAKLYDDVACYKTKPLTEEMINEILEKYFSDAENEPS